MFLRLRQAGWSEMDCGFSEQLLSGICKGWTLQMVESAASYRCTDYKYVMYVVCKYVFGDSM